MPFYSYATVKETACLSDNDKERLLAVLMGCDLTSIFSMTNWDKAATDFGSKSVESMKVMTRGVLKKIEKVGGKSDQEASGVNGDAAAAGKGGRPSPAKKAKKGMAKSLKRAHMDSDSEGDGVEEDYGAEEESDVKDEQD